MADALRKARSEAWKELAKTRTFIGSDTDIKTVLSQVEEYPQIPFEVEKTSDTVKVKLEGKTVLWGLRKGGATWIISYDPGVFGGMER